MQTMELTEMSMAMVVERLWSLPLLLSVSVEANGISSLTEATEAMEPTEGSVVTVVETVWPLPLLLSLSVEADGRR